MTTTRWLLNNLLQTRKRAARTAVLCVLIGAVVGCGRKSPDLMTLTNSYDSPATLCQRVLVALAACDTLALETIRITRFEHDSILVPHMPIGKDTTGHKDLALAWYMLEQRNIKGIRRALADYGGQRFELVSVKFNRPEEKYGHLIVHKGTEVRVRDAAGEEMVLGIFGSILEQDGRYKLVSIRD
ncbi:MAG TPA: hypothetical protein VNN55_09310 [bacterium]|nr:hypothetical protein [bacterium]